MEKSKEYIYLVLNNDDIILGAFKKEDNAIKAKNNLSHNDKNNYKCLTMDIYKKCYCGNLGKIEIKD